ncbi:Ras-related protein Rab-39B [Dirofilaria immitis]|nr:Ras-related protein Rab-39B [Dirofilaria immitis]
MDTEESNIEMPDYTPIGKCAEICDPTVGVDFYARMVEVKPGYRVKLQLWDTAGQEKFRSITRSYYRNSVGVIIVYDITNRLTFEHVGQWLKEAEQNVGGPQPNNCVFQLIGHKADLDDERQVMYEEGEYFAKYNKIKFWKLQQLRESFKMIAREICDRIENGQLRVVDGWEGIRSGMIRTRSLSLSESFDTSYSTCAC